MRKTILFFSIIILTTLACGIPSLSDENKEQISAAATTASEVSSAAATKAVEVATVAAENDLSATAQAAAVSAATVAASAAERGGEAIAILREAGFDREYLRTKFGEVRPDENGNMHFVVTELELNALMLLRQEDLEAAAEEATFSDLNVSITGGHIVVKGNVTSPIEGALDASFRPMVAQIVVDGEVIESTLRFELVSASVNGVEVPASVMGFVENRINNVLFNAFDVMPNKVMLQEAIVEEGQMTLIAQLQ